jgi:tryptophan-rich sensory protein
MNITYIDVLLVVLPAIVGYSSQMICNLGKNAGSNVKFRPPPWVFGVVWPILFLLFGLSWAIAFRNCNNKILCMSMYLLTTLLLGVWIIVYGCGKSKKGASWILILAIASGLSCFTQGNEVSKIMITPLLAWILFALIMNTTEVQNEN